MPMLWLGLYAVSDQWLLLTVSTTRRIRGPRTSGNGSMGQGGVLMTLGEGVSRLTKPKKRAKDYIALCPSQDDRSPSLSISEGRKILLKCFTGCSTDSILKAIGLEMKDLKDLFVQACLPDVRFNGNGSHTTSKPAKAPKLIEALYSNADADGVILYENVRYRPKDLRQRRRDGNGGYTYNLDGIERVPCRLPELMAAMKSGIDEIWLTEGEKDADNVRLLGLTATSFKN